MAKGGYRPGAGRPKGAKNKAGVAPPAASAPGETEEPGKRRTPLEYMLDVMNDVTVDAVRRDRMAIAAAPFQHARAPEGTKREDKEKAAAEAGAGKFSPSAPPLRAVK